MRFDLARRTPQQNPRLALVRRQHVHHPKHFPIQRPRRRWVEHRLRPFFPRNLQPRRHRPHRRLKLKQHERTRREHRPHLLHIGLAQHRIRPRRNHYRVPPLRVHFDHRHARRRRAHRVHAAHVRPRRRQPRLQLIAKGVVPAPPDHPHRQPSRAQSRRRARLVRSLAPRSRVKVVPRHRLARRRQSHRRNHKVHVQAARYGQRGSHRPRSMPSFFISSA